MSYNYSDDEETTFLGTPFAPLESDQIVSRKPDLDLTVRDSKGRRRFHGAFTGGFSAGHFMTVGSEEGFTPQQYVSNRQQRWDQTLIHRKPENFMDSEDLDVFGIAPKKVSTKQQFIEEEFAGFRKSDSLIEVLKSVIKPINESIGRKLYKRMKFNARKDSNYYEKKVYGCEQITENIENQSFLVSYKPKSDFYGIGFKPIVEESDSTHSKNLSGVSATFKSGRKLQISGEAFGYGVLDEDIEDDAVVYQSEDLSKYDFEIGSTKTETKHKNKKGFDILNSDVIEGFTKSLRINLSENIQNKYPIPVIPKEWRKSSSRSKERKSRWDQTNNNSNTSNSKTITEENVNFKTPVLNANIRAILLGEEVIHRQGIKKTSEPEKEDTKVSPKESVKQLLPEKQWSVAKPLFGFWANKFTRSSEGVEETLSGGLTEFKSQQKESFDDNEDKQNEKNLCVERTTYEWHPHTLLCKRFNIPNPFPQYPDFVGVVTVGKSDIRNRTSQISDKKMKPNIFENFFSEQTSMNSSQTSTIEFDVIKNKSVDNISEVKDNNNEDNNEEENEDSTRPPMDLFKAIFASDEESDTEDTDIDKSIKPSVDEIEPKNSSDIKVTENANKGIFANIDFDELNRDFTPLLKNNETTNLTKTLTKTDSQTNNTLIQIKEKTKNNEFNDDLYGPALPPDPSFYSLNTSKGFDLIETNNKSSKRKKKTKKQKKHKKQKTSHKKHRHKHHKSSDSDSIESDEDIEQQILHHLRTSRK